MSKDLTKYILKNYSEFSLSDINSAAVDYSYSVISETINQMEKKGLISWQSSKKKYFVQNLKDYVLDHYQEFTLSDLADVTYFSESDISEKLDQMEKEGVIRWEEENKRYIVIKERDFRKAKQELKIISENLPSKIEFDFLDQGWLDGKKAKAQDINKLTEQFQKGLTDQNEQLRSLYGAFDKVYDTFEALDKDYLQRILVDLKASQQASEEAKRGLKENKKLLENQKVIIEKNKRVIADQKNIIKVLKKNKEELDSLQHLKEIDTFYDDYIDFKTSQEETTKDLYSNQGLVADKITMLSEEYGMFKASQENSIADLRSMQEIAEGELVLIQEGYDGILKKEDSNLVETKNLQEQLSKNIKYLWAGFILNFAIVIILFVLIVSGVV